MLTLLVRVHVQNTRKMYKLNVVSIRFRYWDPYVESSTGTTRGKVAIPEEKMCKNVVSIGWRAFGSYIWGGVRCSGQLA